MRLINSLILFNPIPAPSQLLSLFPWGPQNRTVSALVRSRLRSSIYPRGHRIIGGVAIQSTVGSDHSVVNCATAILTVGLMHRLVAWLKQRSPFGAIVDGTPLVFIKDGQWQPEVMRGMRVDPEDIMAAARSKQIASVFAIKYAVLERMGPSASSRKTSLD